MNVQWQRYKELELLPDSISKPKEQSLNLFFPFVVIWQVLLSALVWEHLCEKRIDYLERCWALNDSYLSHSTHKNKLHQLLLLMDLVPE